jgi:hypothetical protein
MRIAIQAMRIGIALVSKLESKRDGGTHNLRIPPHAVLSTGTPGGVRSTGPLSAVPLRL